MLFYIVFTSICFTNLKKVKYYTIQFLELQLGFINGKNLPGFLFKNPISLNSNGLLFITKGLCIAIFWSKREYYLFDSRSKHSNDACCPDGYSILLRFSTRKALESHIIKYYLEETDVNIQFEAQFIQIKKENENIDLKNIYPRFSEKKLKPKRKNIDNVMQQKVQNKNVGSAKF